MFIINSILISGYWSREVAEHCIIMRLVRLEGAVMRILPEAPLQTSVKFFCAEERRCSSGEHSLKKRSPASVKESLRASIEKSQV
ncbi:hypothetical protein OH492_06570 [Vibrio chagasii]|nr:hypothetical protein [Vibrio chagasii]